LFLCEGYQRLTSLLSSFNPKSSDLANELIASAPRYRDGSKLRGAVNSQGPVI
jgi:hypothetical protein